MVGPMDGHGPVRDSVHYFSTWKKFQDRNPDRFFCPFRILNSFLNFLRATYRTEIKMGTLVQIFSDRNPRESRFKSRPKSRLRTGSTNLGPKIPTTVWSGPAPGDINWQGDLGSGPERGRGKFGQVRTGWIGLKYEQKPTNYGIFTT